MKWIRLWPDYIINGTTFDELDAEVRGVWFSFLALAGYSPFPGEICIAKSLPYTREQMAAIIKIDIGILNRAIDRMSCEEVRKIKVNETGTISILNWNKYQTEYERQKPFRRGLQGKVTKKGYNKKTQRKSISISTSISSSNVVPKEEEIKNNAVLILNHLNHKAGRKFSDTKQIIKMLKAGKPVDQFLQIIDTKLFDPFFTENPQYFNPTTLFRESHWDTYINQKREDFKHREQKIDYRTVGTADEFAADKADIERRKARALTEKNRGETNG